MTSDLTQAVGLTREEIAQVRRLVVARIELIEAVPSELRAAWLPRELEVLQGALKVLKWVKSVPERPAGTNTSDAWRGVLD